MLYKSCNDTILPPIVSRTLSFLSQDMDIKINKNSTKYKCKKRFDFNSYTSIIGLIGNKKDIVIISFTNELLNALVEKLTMGGIISKEEEYEIKISASQEILNTILGNVLDKFRTDDDKMIDMTTPQSFFNANSRDKKVNTLSIDIDTEHGSLSVGIANGNLILESQ